MLIELTVNCIQYCNSLFPDCLLIGKAVESGSLIRGCGRRGVLTASACRFHCVLTRGCKYFAWNRKSHQCEAYGRNNSYLSLFSGPLHRSSFLRFFSGVIGKYLHVLKSPLIKRIFADSVTLLVDRNDVTFGSAVCSSSWNTLYPVPCPRQTLEACWQ